MLAEHERLCTSANFIILCFYWSKLWARASGLNHYKRGGVSIVTEQNNS